MDNLNIPEHPLPWKDCLVVWGAMVLAGWGVIAVALLAIRRAH